ncbi:hypothetical protein H0I76_07365 [Limibaculum sp. M0105]|uniref:Uncharacterized protein n=1 Tax=Thermohalobaculum xanthum TaxID=2753746 RepID=A0A8J7M727_9RHOB|nr:hypothetical protein [Thermohalobaculum xanthum]MBK0399003.1 hypothetical protein [Thermohalobaculum xanthum]
MQLEILKALEGFPAYRNWHDENHGQCHNWRDLARPIDVLRAIGLEATQANRATVLRALKALAARGLVDMATLRGSGRYRRFAAKKHTE